MTTSDRIDGTETNRALQMPIEEASMRAYLQQYPFTVGPDRELNHRCRMEIDKHLAYRPLPDGLPIRKGADAVVRLPPARTHLPGDVMERVTALMDQVLLPAHRRAEMIDDFAWEINLIPRDVKELLVVGCGEGDELIFLRAVLPHARITAVDYTDTITPLRKQVIQVRFFHGDMNTILDRFVAEQEQFDLVSSNHTLEHVYTPDHILSVLGKLIRPGGALTSTLPMDGLEGSPFLEKIRDMASNKKFHPLDMVFLDAGHPWKTNPTDLQATFLRAGFGQVDLYQRAEHLSRNYSAPEAQFEARKRKGRRLHSIFFGVPRFLLKKIFPRKPPALLIRTLIAIERRTWFGSNRLKNAFTQEVCVLAHKPV